MPDIDIDKLQIEVSASSEDAAKQVENLSAALKNLKSSMRGIKNPIPKDLGQETSDLQTSNAEANVKSLASELRNAANSAKELFASIRSGLRGISTYGITATKTLGSVFSFPLKGFTNSIKNAIASVRKFTSSIGRILMYRAIRTLLKDITQSIKDGIDNLSAYSRLIDTEFHKSLDGIASDALYIKNSLASVAAPIINFVKPAFDALADSIANALNILAEFMARITGAASYSKAIKFNTEYGDSIQKAGEKAKQAKKNLLGIDELNIFQEPTSGTGGGFSADDYSKMFEEVKLDAENFGVAEQIRAAIEKDDWRGAGETLAKKLNESIASFNSYDLGKTIGEKINNALESAYGFLKTFDFKKLGGQIASSVNGALEEINFETAGRIFTRKFTVLFDFIIGVVSTLDWKQVGKAAGDYLRGAFNEISDWSKTVNWSEFAKNLWRDVRDFIKGIDFGSLARSFFSFLGSAFAAAVISIGGFFSGVWEDVCEYFRSKTEEAGGDTWEGFKKGVKDAWNNVKNWVKENIVDPFVTAVKDLFGIHSPSTVFQGIGEDIIAGLKTGLRSKWNELKLWWKQQELPSFKVKTPHLSWTTTPASGWISKTLSALGLPTSLPKLNVAWYAKGGFPEDGLFYANHNELVGQFSNGRTAVANNEQITDGIADAVYNAFMSAFSATGNNDNRSIEIYLDGKQIATSTTKYQRQYARATGV